MMTQRTPSYWQPALFAIGLAALLCGLMGWLLAKSQQESRQRLTAQVNLELVVAQAQEKLTELESRLHSESQALLSSAADLQTLTQKLQQEFGFLQTLETRDRQGQLIYRTAPAAAQAERMLSGQLALLESALLTGRAEYRMAEASAVGSPVPVSLIIPARRNEAGSWFATLDMDKLLEGIAPTMQDRWPAGVRVVIGNGLMQRPDRAWLTVEFSRGGLRLPVAAIAPEKGLPTAIAEQSLAALISALAGLMVGLWVRGRWLHRQTLEANRELEAKMQASAKITTLGEMSAAIAHELNQPLGAIENYAHACERILRRGQEQPPGLLEALGHIRNEAQRGGEVIRSIRSLVRRERGRVERVRIADLFAKLRPLLEIQARRYGCEIRISAEASLTVMCERTLLEQVIVNLTNNGLESMEDTPKGLRQLTLNARYDEQAQAVLLAVSDNGSGVSKTNASSLFKPFFTTKADGLGVGLNLCQTIAEQQGGSIVWHNRQERGAEFILRLPLAQSAEVS
jgi:C4-dicarboxylate-specific signal transduction histidine kinase